MLTRPTTPQETGRATVLTVPKINALIAAALERDGGRFRLEDVQQAALDCDVQVWVGERCVVVTTMAEHPGGQKPIRYWLAGGDTVEAVSMQPMIDAWAVSEGCTHAEMLASDEWAEELTSTGWTRGRVEFTKELTR